MENQLVLPTLEGYMSNGKEIRMETLDFEVKINRKDGGLIEGGPLGKFEELFDRFLDEAIELAESEGYLVAGGWAIQEGEDG